MSTAGTYPLLRHVNCWINYGSLRSRSDDTRGGGLWFFLKKDLAKSDEKIVCLENCKKRKSLFTKVAEKMGLYGEKMCLLPCLRKKKRFVSG